MDKKKWSLYVLYNLLREETLPLQFVTYNRGCVRDMIEQKNANPISNLVTDNIYLKRNNMPSMVPFSKHNPCVNFLLHPDRMMDGG